MFSSYSIVRRSFFFPRLSLSPPFLPLVLFSASFRSQPPTMTDFRMTDIVVQDMQDTWWLDKLVRVSKADLKPLVDAALRGRVESYLQPWLQSEVIIFLMTLNAFGGVLSGSMVLAMMIPTIRPYVNDLDIYLALDAYKPMVEHLVFVQGMSISISRASPSSDPIIKDTS